MDKFRSLSNEIIHNDVLSDIQRLDFVDRYSSIPVRFKELVSTHMYWVALYSAIIHRKFGFFPHLESPVLIHALTHDMTEAFSGDFVRTFKYISNDLRNEIKKAEDESVKYFPNIIKQLYEDSYNFSNEERKYIRSVVKAADFLSLFRFMVREQNFGNMELAAFSSRMCDDLYETKKNMEKYLSDKNQDVYDFEKSFLSFYSELCDTASNRRNRPNFTASFGVKI